MLEFLKETAKRTDRKGWEEEGGEMISDFMLVTSKFYVKLLILFLNKPLFMILQRENKRLSFMTQKIIQLSAIKPVF